MTGRRTVVAGLIVALVAVLGAAPAAGSVGPASGATGFGPMSHGWCTRVVLYQAGSYYIHIPATSGGSEHCLMNRGSRGVAPEVLQHSLNQCYLRPNNKTLLVVDGIFGAKTETALRYAQGKENIGVDGVYGPQTRRALKWAYFHQSRCHGRVSTPW